MKQTLYHTSPTEIKKINEYGLFGSCLFFSSTPYVMCGTDSYITYTVEVEEDNILDMSTLFYKYSSDDELADDINDICEAYNVDKDTAEQLLSDEISSCDIEADSDLDFYIQRKSGEIAKKLGYDAALSRDEQGAVYIIDMFRKEELLTKETE